MGVNQSDRQASIRGITGTAYNYEGDWHALFDYQGIASGDFNGRLLTYLNNMLGTSYTNLPGAQAAFATNSGVSSWNEMGSIVPSWVQPAAIIDEIFTTGQYWPRQIATELVDTRASTKYVTNASGILVPIASNILPISNTGMLVEPIGANLLVQSADLTTTWLAINGTVASSAVAGPDNVGTLQNITATSASNRVQQNQTVTAGKITISVFFKPGSANFGGIAGHDGGGTNGAGAIFNISTGAVVSTTINGSASAASATIIPYANGLFRASLTYTTVITAVYAAFGVSDGSTYINATLPSAASGNVFSGYAQMEQGNPSSYIPTATASATRAADAIVIQRTGLGRIVFTFDDNSQQTVSGINTAAQYTIPTNLNRPLIKRMTGYAV